MLFFLMFFLLDRHCKCVNVILRTVLTRGRFAGKGSGTNSDKNLLAGNVPAKRLVQGRIQDFFYLGGGAPLTNGVTETT